MRHGARAHLRTAAITACLCVVPLLVNAQPSGARAHAFRGRVIAVDATAGTLTVANEKVDGWMDAMTMGYKTDKPEVLKTLKAGDTITATVYDGEFATLYRIEVAVSVASADDLPPISYVCPTPAEANYVDFEPGKCPVSGAPLVPTRLVTAYSCLRNQLFIREAPGLCPTDRTDLVPITVDMYFTCANDKSLREMNPGTCADGSPRIKAFQRRPHGDHNPRHGGGFVFMAVDQWHHLEGIFVKPGIFRLYLYDDMMRPLAASQLSGRVMLADANAQPIGNPIPLVLGTSADHSTMEARVPAPGFPFNLKVLMTFKPNEKEQVFDFTFADYSKES